jgi:hypothetical protein
MEADKSPIPNLLQLPQELLQNVVALVSRSSHPSCTSQKLRIASRPFQQLRAPFDELFSLELLAKHVHQVRLDPQPAQNGQGSHACGPCLPLNAELHEQCTARRSHCRLMRF